MTRSLLAAAVLLFATAAFAGPDKGKATSAAGPKCPGGGNYTLKQTPSKGHTTKVTIGGKTYYACKPCADKLNKGTAKAKAKDACGDCPAHATKTAAKAKAKDACGDCPAHASKAAEKAKANAKKS